MLKAKQARGRYRPAYRVPQEIAEETFSGQEAAWSVSSTALFSRRESQGGRGAVCASARPAGLTRREFEVLQLVAAGLSNDQIAAQLEITLTTVVSYLNRIYQKLNVSSRTAAIRYALDHGFYVPAQRALSSTTGQADRRASASALSTRASELTRRELDILRLVAVGLSNAEIAERLIIALTTVISYLNDIYKKLGVSSRTEAMRYALDHCLCS